MQLFRSVCSILFLVLLWAGSVVWFSYHISHYKLDPTQEADGIIVLTGGDKRIDTGLELLAEGRAQLLFISGVNKNVTLATLIAKAPQDIRDQLDESALSSITLGRNADNTIGNAEESIHWLQKNKLKSVFLVTADYHMPRALTEFKNAIKGVDFIPAPVTTGNYSDLSWIADDADRNMVLSEFHKLIAARLRHQFIKASEQP